MKSCLLILLVAVTVSAAGCARNRVIVDTQNTNMAQYERDHAECETYASQVSTGGKAAGAAATGTLSTRPGWHRQWRQAQWNRRSWAPAGH